MLIVVLQWVLSSYYSNFLCYILLKISIKSDLYKKKSLYLHFIKLRLYNNSLKSSFGK